MNKDDGNYDGNNDGNNDRNSAMDNFDIFAFDFDMAEFMTEEEIALQAVALLGMDEEQIIPTEDNETGATGGVEDLPHVEGGDPIIGMIVAGEVDDWYRPTFETLRMFESFYLLYKSDPKVYPVWTQY